MSKYLGLSLTVLVCLAGRCFGIGGDMGRTTQPLTDGSTVYPYLIEDTDDLDMFGDIFFAHVYWGNAVHTRLTCDLDLTGRTYALFAAVVAPDTSSSIGFQGTPFAGVFDGNGHVIRNLTIHVGSANHEYIGLFGKIAGTGAEIKNLGIENVAIIGGDGPGCVGTLCGGNDGGDIHDCWVRGAVTTGGSSSDIGGLCGTMNGGYLTNCRVSVSVDCSEMSQYVGGVCGTNVNGTIENVYAIESIIAGSYSLSIGGLCGSNSGWIDYCYAAGMVTGDSNVGGLCGSNNGGTVADCYAIGDVVGGMGYTAGLCAENSSGSFSRCYAGGAVSGGSFFWPAGGLCAFNNGTISDSFWDRETSGMTSSDGGTGKTTAQMQSESTFAAAGWDFNETWWINEARDYPRLFWQPFGDVDNDSRVDLNDFAVMAAAWGSELGDGNYNSVCELSGDDAIDTADLVVLAGVWLEGPGW